MDAALLEVIACPRCRSPLQVDDSAAELVCTSSSCRLAYPVRDGIPVLLVDEARTRAPGPA
ncbi:MAG: Trm112 family protein [Sporichthyaceae bacterium]|nr:Trm112 family protein [Sporichthyaceae bacterium]